MGEGKDELNIAGVLAFLDRRCKAVVFLAWLGLSAWFLYDRWDQLRAFGLGDTDDNMRMSQVRALLHGQDWFDLRQHKLAGSNIHWSRRVDLPPAGRGGFPLRQHTRAGSNIHWSRLVALPLAGLILLLRPFLGGPQAELVS